MLSELFTPVETPEAPNRGFFKGLFGGGAQSLDREDLCEYRMALYQIIIKPFFFFSLIVLHRWVLELVNTLNGFLFLSLVVGETGAGKASRSLAQHIPGPGSMEGMKGAASGVVGDLARARIALDERGQKLGDLEERTAAMMASAESFSKHAHDVCTCHFFEHLKHCLQVFFYF